MIGKFICSIRRNTAFCKPRNFPPVPEAVFLSDPLRLHLPAVISGIFPEKRYTEKSNFNSGREIL